MQVRGTFPELSAGRKKTRAKAPRVGGMGGFAIKGRAPKRTHVPSSFAGRRAAAHAKARGY